MSEAVSAERVRVAVVGHVEWVTFAVVERLPARGAITFADETWDEAAGGGGVAAVQLARLGAECELFCAFGNDAVGAQASAGVAARGVTVHGMRRAEPHARAFVHLDAGAERTITVLRTRMGPRGEDPLPWERLDDAAAAYFTAGDIDALEAARRARTLVATARALDTLAPARVPVDVLVASARDPGERYEPGMLDPPPRVVVLTDGERGGTWSASDGSHGAWSAAALPGAPVDAYGCGDSFAAGLTLALARGLSLASALELGARCGATCLVGRGPYGAPLEGLADNGFR